MKFFNWLPLFFYAFVLSPPNAAAQSGELAKALKNYFTAYHAEGFAPHLIQVRLKDCKVDKLQRHIHVYGNEGFSSQLFTPPVVEKIYKDVSSIIPKTYDGYSVSIYASGKEISTLVPNVLCDNKFPERLWNLDDYKGRPWTSNASRPVRFQNGLQNRHISVWASHGRYYRHDKRRWDWQRPYLFCTTEDMFTLSFVTPFLIPMLENSGAVVFTPRERDWQTNEAIVDDDGLTKGFYTEENRNNEWKLSGIKGHSREKDTCRTNENPFVNGTAKYIATVNQPKYASYATWTPQIPEDGKYAVYVCYQNLPDNVDDAHYTVVHKGVKTQILVNQQMGGGTWVYLGTFEFGKGNANGNYVSLSNFSRSAGTVSADAVRFGGGVGNILRGNASDGETCSGLPKFLECARYSVQNAGFPTYTYDVKGGDDDYGDDLNTRSLVLNHLASGSVFVPGGKGGVPLELSVAVHSDAGTTNNNSIYGTLTIHTQRNEYNETKYSSGLTRMASSDLAQIIQKTIYEDLNRKLGVPWIRREVLNRKYNETHYPDIPSSIVEILSHQNFKDMCFGFDPNFKFLMARSIYKAIARFACGQHQQECTIQPLPIQALACEFKGDNKVLLKWTAPVDELEPTAKPDGYIVYVRKEGEDFDNGTVVLSTQYEMEIKTNTIYSFKVSAYNKGGESFASEELSAMRASENEKEILIINGFNRLGGPAIVEADDSLGFDLDEDMGVSYMKTAEFCGRQINFNRRSRGKVGENALGYCGSELEGKIIAGNSFNYPFVHGKAIQSCKNCSFVSCNVKALQNNIASMRDYFMVDVLLGLQKDDRNSSIVSYKSFPETLRNQLEAYNQGGGKIFVSGAYIASDMKNSRDSEFTSRVLHYKNVPERFMGRESEICVDTLKFNIVRDLNPKQYAVMHPDIICPTNGSVRTFTYADGSCAGAAYCEGESKVVALGFPFESIDDARNRQTIMQTIVRIMSAP